MGGNLSQLVYLTPHPRFWSSDCLQLMKWLWSIHYLKWWNFLIIQTFSACLHSSVNLNTFDDRWGATYPSWFTLPPTQIFLQWLAMDSELLLIALTTINGYVSQNACKYTTKQFMKFIHLLVGGNISQLVYLTPHPRFWSSDCLHIIKWLWSITLLKMMKFSSNPNIFCLFTLISQLKYLRWRVGGNLSQLVYLAPHSDFWAVIGYGFRMDAKCCYNY